MPSIISPSRILWPRLSPQLSRARVYLSPGILIMLESCPTPLSYFYPSLPHTYAQAYSYIRIYWGDRHGLFYCSFDGCAPRGPPPTKYTSWKAFTVRWLARAPIAATGPEYDLQSGCEDLQCALEFMRAHPRVHCACVSSVRAAFTFSGPVRRCETILHAFTGDGAGVLCFPFALSDTMRSMLHWFSGQLLFISIKYSS